MPPPPRSWTARRGRGDVAAVVAVLALTAVAVWPLLRGGTIVGQDSATQFYPWYAFLGERLRAGHLPGWNPSQFSGAPFAADPQSGWMYLPAMLLFTLLPLAAAAPAFVVAHLLLAGLATYALGRVLGLTASGALTAAVAYEFSAVLYGRVACCPASVELTAWVPPTLLGAELALRSRSRLARAGWWGATGFALSQVFAAWPGQGAYYALLALGGYLAYRTLVAPPVPAPARRARPAALALHGAGILLFAGGLAAAGLLPRLEYNAASNLAGGAYRGDLAWAAALGGWTPGVMARWLLGQALHYPGAEVLLLAAVAPLVARRQFATTYFAGLALGGLILAANTTTPLHAALYLLLPRFAALHRHIPERVMYVAFLGPAILAGAAASALPRWRRASGVVVAVALLPVAGAFLRRGHLGRPSVLAGQALAFAALALALPALLRAGTLRRALPVVLPLVLFADLFAAGDAALAHGPFGGFARVNLGTYYAASGAGAFLRSRPADQPFRFFGYDPQLQALEDGQRDIYRDQFADPRALALLVNNRATSLGLQDVQGYNPVQVARYTEYVRALNGRPQEYHGADVLAEGLGSPLLDLLGARYVVVPAATPADRADLQRLNRAYPTVYRDGQVRVLENRAALPRAWIVHAARQVARGEALPLLAGRAVDPRRTALLEAPPPVLGRPRRPAADQASVTGDEPDRIQLRTATDAPGLLVLSEVYYPAWKAYVDGKSARLYVADHALRAVAVPAGAHTVELRYESRGLRVGVAISLATAAVVATLAAALLLRAVGPGPLPLGGRIRRRDGDAGGRRAPCRRVRIRVCAPADD